MKARSRALPREPRARLIAAAADVLLRRGVGGLGLREVARRAGVSHGAPLRHFAGVSELRSAVAAEGYRRLFAEIEAAAAALGPRASARARLAAAGAAYVRCALAQRETFELMFRRELLDPEEPSLAEAANAAFGQLLGLIRAAQAEGWQASLDERVVASAVWSTVHGLAQLWIHGALPPDSAALGLEAHLAGVLALLLPKPPRAATKRAR